MLEQSPTEKCCEGSNITRGTRKWESFYQQTRREDVRRGSIDVQCLPFHGLQSYGGFYKNYQSGNTKNAADFAMMLQIGKMAELLPERVQFIILSGDKGFQEAVHQLKDTRRTIRIINPHIPGWQTTLHNILHQHNGQFLQQGTRPGI
ncbi:hypothetical protein Ahia01_000324400 [Argonauta hians]